MAKRVSQSGYRSKKKVIVEVCDFLFRGYELELNGKTKPLLELVIRLRNCLNSETGDIQILPFSGGMLEQPPEILFILEVVQNEFRKHIEREMKKLRK